MPRGRWLLARRISLLGGPSPCMSLVDPDRRLGPAGIRRVKPPNGRLATSAAIPFARRAATRSSQGRRPGRRASRMRAAIGRRRLAWAACIRCRQSDCGQQTSVAPWPQRQSPVGRTHLQHRHSDSSEATSPLGLQRRRVLARPATEVTGVDDSCRDHLAQGATVRPDHPDAARLATAGNKGDRTPRQVTTPGARRSRGPR